MPPGALAGVGVLVGGGFSIVFLAGIGLVDEVAPLLATGDHAIDGAPVGKTAYIAVVDEEVGLQLAREVGIVVGGLFRVVTIGGIERYATLTTPFEGGI